MCKASSYLTALESRPSVSTTAIAMNFRRSLNLKMHLVIIALVLVSELNFSECQNVSSESEGKRGQKLRKFRNLFQKCWH